MALIFTFCHIYCAAERHNRYISSASRSTILQIGSPGYRRKTLERQDARIRAILRETRRIAVMGASVNPQRPVWQVMMVLAEHGYDVIPVGPKVAGKVIDGMPGYASLAEIPGKVDMVDVFRNPQVVPEIARQAIAIGAKTLWLQPGTVNLQAVTEARDAGLQVITELCPKIEIYRSGLSAELKGRGSHQ